MFILRYVLSFTESKKKGGLSLPFSNMRLAITSCVQMTAATLPLSLDYTRITQSSSSLSPFCTPFR